MKNLIAKIVFVAIALLLFDATTTLYAWDELAYWIGIGACVLMFQLFDKLED